MFQPLLKVNLQWLRTNQNPQYEETHQTQQVDSLA
jgi:hypothetical protein